MKRGRLDLTELLDAVDMEEWLSFQGLEYKKVRGTRGEQLNVKTCPSCGKSEYKVYLNAETGLGNCFSGSCPKGTFNKFSFIREHLYSFSDNSNVIEHIKGFAREMGWRPKRIAAVAVDMESDDLELPDYEPIPINGRNLKYLANRRVDIDTAMYFNLGYIKDGFFKKRIFIPIHDLDGSLVSFQARDVTGKAEKKYLFPRGFAATGKILYNGQNALGRKHILMVEGVFDVIGAKLAMDENMSFRGLGIVGSFGMSLSGDTEDGGDDQLSRFIQLRDRGLESVTIMWDPERKATVKAIKVGSILRAIGLKVRIALLPAGRDPGNAAPAIIRECFINALPLTHTNVIKMLMAT